MMFEQFASVTLTRDLPDVGLTAGMSGAITDVVAEHQVCIVEFFDEAGETVAVEYVPQDALRLTTTAEHTARKARRVAAE